LTCAKCTAALLSDVKFCEECGTPLAEPTACGHEQIDEDGFCTACGMRRDVRARDHFEIEFSSVFAAVSDKGHRHHRNEDFVSLGEMAGDSVIVVCDGVSSTDDPDKASEAAAHAALQALLDRETMKAAILAAQKATAKVANGRGEDSPATTIVAAVVSDNVVTIGWLGDSRAYWIGADTARQLTEDHSWLNEAVASGEFSEVEARRNGNAHAITRWLGADAPGNLDVSVVRFELKEPGWLLLCTDGLWNYAPETESIADLVRASGTQALQIARNLVSFANAQGGQDNITAALLSL
jgi:serine/threonine protein phosphatase PrpC